MKLQLNLSPHWLVGIFRLTTSRQRRSRLARSLALLRLGAVGAGFLGTRLRSRGREVTLCNLQHRAYVSRRSRHLRDWAREHAAFALGRNLPNKSTVADDYLGELEPAD